MGNMKKHLSRILYILWFAVFCIPAIRLLFRGNRILAAGVAFWGLFVFLLIAFRPASPLHKTEAGRQPRALKALTIVVLCAVIALTTLPMGISPRHNGTSIDFHYQYEALTESILEGHFYLDREVPDALLAMENPYDFEARKELGITYEWDTALYDGRYYVYFGIAPVVLLFLPYKLITGRTLLSYHGTQLFTALFIIGLFALLHQIAKRFFPKAPCSLVLLLSASFSVMSVWFATGAPALYCTAISAGICFQVWSFFFHMRAVYIETDFKKQTLFAFLGSLSGALVFASRPPVGIAALVSVPMLVHHIRNLKQNRAPDRRRILFQTGLAALPYPLVAIPLMWYNARRFDSPFEFGQAYMLTNGDLLSCRNFAEHFNPVQILSGIGTMLIRFDGLNEQFPYFTRNGVFVNFPLLLTVFAIVFLPVRQVLKEKGLKQTVYALLIVTLVITAFQTYWVTGLIERYRMDIYFLLAIAAFIVLLSWHETLPDGKHLRTAVCLLAIYALFASFFLYMVPEDQNATHGNEAFFYWTRYAVSLGRLQ